MKGGVSRASSNGIGITSLEEPHFNETSLPVAGFTTICLAPEGARLVPLAL
jgi:hypothetical protein